MSRAAKLRTRIRVLLWLFITGMVISGATAIPLQTEVHQLATTLVDPAHPTLMSTWLQKVADALEDIGAKHQFLFYGTDWLAFGHFIIALAFVGAVRDPIRNKWLFTFGLLSCALVIPYAMIFGALRGIPLFWRVIDCSFGIVGAIPLLLCRKWVAVLERCDCTSPYQSPAIKS